MSRIRVPARREASSPRSYLSARIRVIRGSSSFFRGLTFGAASVNRYRQTVEECGFRMAAQFRRRGQDEQGVMLDGLCADLSRRREGSVCSGGQRAAETVEPRIDVAAG